MKTRAVDVVNMCNAGYLDRIRHGYYQLAEVDSSSEEQLLVTLIPKGIDCVESALFHYGYSDFAPRKWSIAVPRSMSRTKLDVDALALQTYYVQSEIYELGRIIDDFDGSVLTEALRKTFENRGHTFNIEQFEQVMAFDEDEAMQKKWKAFCRKIDTKTDDYSTVLRTIKDFLSKPIVAAINVTCFNEQWNAATNTWGKEASTRAKIFQGMKGYA